jgi:hypothetical protein
LDGIGNQVTSKDVPALKDAVSGIPNATVITNIMSILNKIKTSVDNAESKIANIKTEAEKVNTANITGTVEDVENYR